jgi:hypothetical protein
MGTPERAQTFGEEGDPAVFGYLPGQPDLNNGATGREGALWQCGVGTMPQRTSRDRVAVQALTSGRGWPFGGTSHTYWKSTHTEAQGESPLGFGMVAYSLTHRPVDTPPLYHMPGSRTRGVCTTGTLASHGKGKGGFRTGPFFPRAGREDHRDRGPSGLTWLHGRLSRQLHAPVDEQSRASSVKAPDGGKGSQPSSPRASAALLDVSAWVPKTLLAARSRVHKGVLDTPAPKYRERTSLDEALMN